MELVQRLRSYRPKGDGSLWSQPSKDTALAADLIEKQAAELAAEQAKNVGLREALLEYRTFFSSITAGKEALSAPSDTSALETMIAKAGEKMRERIRIAKAQGWLSDGLIRTLPGVTLEDLK